MTRWHYKGPIMIFDQIVSEDWEAYTYADTEKKAKSNFIFQAKMMLGRTPGSKLALPGRLTPTNGVKSKKNVYEDKSVQLHF